MTRFAYPVSLDVKGRRCVVSGGTALAEEKARGLLEAGARVVVFASSTTPGIQELAARGEVQLTARHIRPGDLHGAFLAIATGDHESNAALFAEAEREGVLLNAVDDVDNCHFAAPSIVRRGDLSVAISTGGRAPALAKQLRLRLERELEPELAILVALCGDVRDETLDVRSNLDFSSWASRWAGALRPELLEMIRNGEVARAREQILRTIQAGVPPKRGRVAIVGAGPGAGDLISVRGKNLIDRADVIVHDRLIDPDLISGKEAIYAGKVPGGPSVSQEDINGLLVRLAHGGLQVVRLKGGDPFVFGRGAEEAEALMAAGIDFEIVPGVTAAVAAPAFAGIPVTDRRTSSSVAIVTGHRGAEGQDWEALVRSVDTIVVLMGLGHLDAISDALVAAGLAPTTPVAVVQRASHRSQRELRGTVATIAREVRRHGLSPPATIVIGDVVEVGDRLRWFEPLGGSSTESLSSSGARR